MGGRGGGTEPPGDVSLLFTQVSKEGKKKKTTTDQRGKSLLLVTLTLTSQGSHQHAVHYCPNSFKVHPAKAWGPVVASLLPSQVATAGGWETSPIPHILKPEWFHVCWVTVQSLV